MFPTGCRPRSSGMKWSDNKTSVEWRCYLFLSEVTGTTSWSTMHCNKKWAKRSFPLENNLPEEGKFPCGYWNIYPFTHTVFIHSSVREKCSRPWAGTFYRSKKGKLPGVDFSHRYFRKIPAFRISQGHFRKIPAFPREECSRRPLPPWLILEKLTL